jgi:hypothetical protein
MPTEKQLKKYRKSATNYLSRLLSNTDSLSEYIAQYPSRYRDLSGYIKKYPALSTHEIAQRIVADMQRVVALINIRERLNSAMMSEFGWTLFTADRYFAMKYFAYELKMTPFHSDAYERWKMWMSRDDMNEFVDEHMSMTLRLRRNADLFFNR